MTDITSEVIDLSAYDPELARMARARDSYEDDQREHIQRHLDRIDASSQAIEGAFRRLIASGGDPTEELKLFKATGLSMQLVAELIAYRAKQEG